MCFYVYSRALCTSITVTFLSENRIEFASLANCVRSILFRSAVKRGGGLSRRFIGVRSCVILTKYLPDLASRPHLYPELMLVFLPLVGTELLGLIIYGRGGI